MGGSQPQPQPHILQVKARLYSTKEVYCKHVVHKHNHGSSLGAEAADKCLE
ncbi:unnamed protein product [Dovyalis caffra]|uniref:Uncharacterized protein n=1 Tax=Dovyalis caffra TaxID=77055 RepID=A0AAV1RCT7_9ROSI|nr:unnamed protein product [Dovyalis caffra]